MALRDAKLHFRKREEATLTTPITQPLAGSLYWGLYRKRPMRHQVIARQALGLLTVKLRQKGLHESGFQRDWLACQPDKLAA